MRRGRHGCRHVTTCLAFASMCQKYGHRQTSVRMSGMGCHQSKLLIRSLPIFKRVRHPAQILARASPRMSSDPGGKTTSEETPPKIERTKNTAMWISETTSAHPHLVSNYHHNVDF
ncbi:hypothetical protein TGDOM2_399110 [Toxoplasma gondii GAB2-2007-GAL-DOM2]|uniref:Uncharacterized protein n=1 Tax=Toxoplasma gondii GAB2-2007-GAL-DOM2 TaxID=1130820 RepID=A0A086KAU6_TOXGO|nr:hypothetical protein TGDOM2_399110 [Toxoplasma gondii GAB2-2007-GAL-DOM2]